MTDELREKMEAAIKAAEAVKYEGVGTVEFLVDANRDFYFMEMNTRIQVEHTITEEVVNYDLIKEQIKLAAGENISGKNYYPQMHAIQCRINAEDPARNFAPCPGRITDYHAPGGHGVRLDTHVYSGTNPPVLRLDDFKAHRCCSNPGGSHFENATGLGRVRHRRHQNDHPIPSAPHAPRPLPQGDFTTKFMEEEDV